MKRFRFATIVSTALMTVSALANAITASALSTTNHGSYLTIYETVNKRFEYSDYLFECCETAAQIIEDNNYQLGNWEEYIPEAIAMSSGYPQNVLIDGTNESLTYIMINDSNPRLATAALTYTPYKEIKDNAGNWTTSKAHFTVDILDDYGYIVDFYRDETRIKVTVEDATGQSELGSFDLDGSEFWDVNIESLIAPCLTCNESNLYIEYSVFDLAIAGQLENFALDLMNALSPATETSAATTTATTATATTTTTTMTEDKTAMSATFAINGENITYLFNQTGADIYYNDTKNCFIVIFNDETVIAHSMSELISAFRAHE